MLVLSSAARDERSEVICGVTGSSFHLIRPHRHQIQILLFTVSLQQRVLDRCYEAKGVVGEGGMSLSTRTLCDDDSTHHLRQGLFLRLLPFANQTETK